MRPESSSPAEAESRGSWRALFSVAAAAIVLWWSAFDHPLYPSDEGRYALVAATMAESGDWVVPMRGGEPHLTKPPFAYWAEAVGVLAFGRTEAAARLPSLLAATGTLLAVFLVTRRQRGDAAAAGAVLLLGILPLFVFVARIGATDALLTFFWSMATLSGYLIVAGVRRSNPMVACFWACVGLAAITKGPMALGPIAILVTWRLLAGDLRSLAALKPWWGVPFATLPLIAWVAAIAWRDVSLLSSLLESWHIESIGRVTGELGKADPWWLYLPIFLVGLFPATAMLTVPVANLSWRESWDSLRRGSLESLLVVAAIVPMIGFSVSSGKLPTYIAPVAPPIAMLVGIMIARQWLSPAPTYGHPPDVRWTLFVTTAIAAIVAPVAVTITADRFNLSALRFPLSVTFLPALVGSIWLVASWRRQSFRRSAFLIAWVGFACSWMMAFRIENEVTRRESPELLVATLREKFGDDAPIFVVGSNDATRSFYRQGPVRELGGNPPSWTIGLAMSASRGAVFELDKWQELQRMMPEIAIDLPPVAEVPGFFGRRYVVVRVGREPSDSRP